MKLTGKTVSDFVRTAWQIIRDYYAKLYSDGKSDRHAIYPLTLPAMPQFRTTRHLDGDHTFTVDDVYIHYDDSIGAICDFDHRDFLFEVRYGTICKRGYPNVLAAGRCADGTGYGWDLLRVIPPAILTGQAAANAACLAIEEKTAVASVDIKRLQTVQEKDNVMVHFPDEYLPEDRTVVIHGKNAAEIEGGHL